MEANQIAANITEQLAFEMEEVEKNAWQDMYTAAPAGYAEGMKILQVQMGDATLITAALPAGLFNRAFMHGLSSALGNDEIKDMMNFFAASNSPVYHIYATPFSKPEHIEQLYSSHGLEIVSATDKVYCELDNVHPLNETPAGYTIKLVDADSAAVWADFICTIYGGLPNHPWLQALVHREGWYHAFAEQNGNIIACRSMYIDGNKRAWLGIDAPIPGIMTDWMEPDYYLCGTLLQIAKSKNIRLVNSCVEGIDPTRETDAYQYYYKLGFKVAYRRKNFGMKH